jgi:hypothetical protein
LSIERRFTRLAGLPAVFVAEWRAGLLTISWPHHSHEGKCVALEHKSSCKIQSLPYGFYLEI